MKTTEVQEAATGAATESLPGFITKKVFSERMSWSARTTDNFLKARKIPFCKLGKIVRIPWPEARDHVLRNYRINALGE
jgi:hypothetical protein